MICTALFLGHSVVAFAANTAPTISGTPATSATVGKAYSFRPQASDPDGNKLTFRIRQKPGWASFSTASGELSGRPSAAHVATYSNIEISVSDGRVTRALPKFSIKVNQAAAPTTSEVTLSWLPPTRNVDGSALTNLAGYQIHYGKTPGQYAYSLAVGGAQITSAVIQNLEKTTWFFAIKAVTSSGALSEFSPEVSRTLF